MMQTLKISGPLSVILVSLFLSGVSGAKPTLSHTVRPGESISLICIDLFGSYTMQMGTEVRKLNPQIEDINIIRVGQKIQFPDPTAQKESQSDPVFTRNLAITQGVITYVEGTAHITRSGFSKSQTLTVNTIVAPGDVIETGSDGRVEIIINRESVLRLKEKTRVSLDAFRDIKKDSGKTTAGFSLGTVWTKVKKFSTKVSRFQLELPTAVAGVYGTVYNTSVSQDSSARVQVYTGEVAVNGKKEAKQSDQNPAGPHEVPGPQEVTMEEWTRIVRTMQEIHIASNGKPTDTKTFTRDPEDSWEKWNEERDKRIAEMFGED